MVLFSWGWTGFGQSGTGLTGTGVDQGITSPTITKLPSNTGQLTSVAAGNFHSACVDIQGNLYTWGNARRGECGHTIKDTRGTPGPDKEEEIIPRLLRSKNENVRFKMVACGMYHTLALTTTRLVYTWGSNELGQLGLGKYGPMSTTRPIKIDSLDKAQIFTLAAGDGFSVAIGVRTLRIHDDDDDDDGDEVNANEVNDSAAEVVKSDVNQKGCSIFTWGENNKGQLGRDTNGNLYDKFVGHVKISTSSIEKEHNGSSIPNDMFHENQNPVPAADEVMVYMAACGSEHLLLLTTKGIIYSCGSNADGQLGLGHYKASEIPKPIDNFLSRGLVVNKITASGSVSGALAYSFNKFSLHSSNDVQNETCKINSNSNSMNVFMWGSNSEGQLGDGGAKITRRNIPGPCFVGGQYDVIDLAVGEEHTVALCYDHQSTTFSKFQNIKNNRYRKHRNANNDSDDNNNHNDDDDDDNDDSDCESHFSKKKKKNKKKEAASGEVVGHLVVWGRSAGGRLGIGNVDAFQSHLVHGAGQTKQTETDLENSHGGLETSVGKEVAFYQSMAAVFLDDALNFHTPVTAPFNPFLEHSDLLKDFTQAEGNSSESDEDDDESVFRVKMHQDRDVLKLKGIVAGGAHTFVYGKLETNKMLDVSNLLTEKKTMKNKHMLANFLDEDKGQEDVDNNEQGHIEFPESYGANALVGATKGGGWKQWKVCPRIGCNVCLPDELADWHETLCNKPYKQKDQEVVVQEQKEEEKEKGISSPKESHQLPQSQTSHSIQSIDKYPKRLPSLPRFKNVIESHPVDINAVETVQKQFDSPVLPSVRPVSTQTVKKRIGGGFAYVTVPSPSK